MRTYLIMRSRRVKQGIVCIADIAFSLFATWSAFSLRLDSFDWPQAYQWPVYILAPVLSTPVFVRLGLYRAVFRYTGMTAMLTVMKATVLCGIGLFVILLWLTLPGIPRSVGLLQPLLFLMLVGSSRAFARFWLNQGANDRRKNTQSRLLIYGAGAVGAQMAEVLVKKEDVFFVGFIDDDVQLIGKTINGQQVYSPSEIDALIKAHAVTDVLLALGKIESQRRKEILTNLRSRHVRVRTLPDLTELAQGKVTELDIHELEISDLLGRDAVEPDLSLIGKNVQGKVVLVTGAGGSIGSELCRQILAAQPARLLLIEHSEFALYEIHSSLLARANAMGVGTEIVPLLGSVRDRERLREIFNAWSPETVYHAAAYKHVPLVEHNPAEGIRNNVFGTYNVACAAVEAGASDFVLISTDKAVRPTNVMGASKRLAEMILQALANTREPMFKCMTEQPVIFRNRTRFSMVRFGNVLGSSGSVVPLFRQQIKNGGPITLTDKEVTRYFMTIPEAAQLVIQAGAMAQGGDVFVLDMGEPVKIVDLAYRMIELSGLTIKNDANPMGDIEVQVTGLRPGEKLYEELLIGENPEPTMHVRIMKAHEDCVSWDELQANLIIMQQATTDNDIVTISGILSELVSGYSVSGQTVDWIHLKQNVRVA